jgi:hypothetical protein
MMQVRCADRKGLRAHPQHYLAEVIFSIQLLIANMQPPISSNLEVDLTD